jgi:hypothetical protein
LEDQGQGGLGLPGGLPGAAMLRGPSSEGEGPRLLHRAPPLVESQPIMLALGPPPGADHPQHAQAEVLVPDSDDEGLPALSRD